jgi:hypothetical protein
MGAGEYPLRDAAAVRLTSVVETGHAIIQSCTITYNHVQ